MIYVDKPRSFAGKRKKYSHMMANDLGELHAFAESIGVKRCWFDKDHYDINESQYALAIKAGATLVRPRDLIKLRK